MRSGLVFSLLVVVGVSGAAPMAFAQATGGVASMSDAEKAAVATMLDSVGTKQGEELRQSLAGSVRQLSESGGNPRSVMTAVKVGAGNRLPVLDQALTDLCLSGGAGGRIYCQLAALQAPTSTEGDTQTAATQGAPGAPAANAPGTIGGSAQGNSGSNNGGTPSIARSILPNTIPSTFTPTTFTPTTFTPVPTPTPVPGPVAGAGLVSGSVLAFGWLLSAARRRLRADGASPRRDEIAAPIL